jgi:hypothetical protein
VAQIKSNKTGAKYHLLDKCVPRRCTLGVEWNLYSIVDWEYSGFCYTYLNSITYWFWANCPNFVNQCYKTIILIIILDLLKNPHFSIICYWFISDYIIKKLLGIFNFDLFNVQTRSSFLTKTTHKMKILNWLSLN